MGNYAEQQLNKDYQQSRPASTGPDTSSPIRDTVTSMEDLVSHLHKQAQEFENRLDTCLEVQPPQPSSSLAGGAPAGPINSPHLLTRMKMLQVSLSQLGDRYQQLMQRVQI